MVKFYLTLNILTNHNLPGYHSNPHDTHKLLIPHDQVASLPTMYPIRWLVSLQLTNLLTSDSATHVLYLRRQLLTIKKGSISMSAYIDYVHGILDNLVTVGEVFKEPEVVLTVVDGLGPEYVSFATLLKTKFDHTHLHQPSMLM